jgi:hypothetical protein
LRDPERRNQSMGNHLTPSEMANESGLDTHDVIVKCVEMGVPIYEGKIDKTLFSASLRATEPGYAPAISAT